MEHSETLEFRFSEFISLVEVDRGVLLAHGPLMQRIVLDEELAAPVRELRQTRFTAAAFSKAYDAPEAGRTLFASLRERGLVVPVDADEAELVRATARPGPLATRDRSVSAWPTARYGTAPRLTAQELRTAHRDGRDGLAPLTVLLLGGCVTQFAEAPLTERGLARGKDVRTVHEWPGSAAQTARSIARTEPDLTVYQAGVQPFLTALWDRAHLIDAAERARLLGLMKSALSVNISALARALEGRLGLVHNFGPPALSPFGRFDFAEEYGMRRLTAELNAHIDHCVRRHSHLAVVDEERLVRMYGAPALFDDLHYPFAHHGGSLDPEREDAHQLPALGEALADEYLALHAVHRGEDIVKCVVVDLDNTLWPGIAADDGFGWLDTDATSRWVHLGLHQALSVLKSRGILLATCSKGDEKATLDVWRASGGRQLLDPDDFVLHRINWQPKSANVAEICARLGFDPSQVMFLDDHPVERAEVAHALPSVRVVDAPVHAFRSRLLTDPALEVRAPTEAARRRAGTTRAMLARDELAVGVDREEFLSSLGIGLSVTEETESGADLERVAELFNRTNQFTTTGRRTTAEELARHLGAPDTRLYTAQVSDRFTDYGLVGACLIEGGDGSGAGGSGDGTGDSRSSDGTGDSRSGDGTGTLVVDAFALSCRVIGLDVAVPFLASALDDAARGRSLAGARGRVVVTARNTPAQDLYPDAGFEPAPVHPSADRPAAPSPPSERHYVLADPRRLRAARGAAVTVTVTVRQNPTEPSQPPAEKEDLT
ncbi:HAD-IIIC family phosphatase [Streptomyces sp. NBC_00237]|uniref:HAD-IIIC family phosphatase n=1 Tax=Streptomyces sp. NBC_00237 TaxID=2975687 RepID=UPI0022529037|nr:HAD-IIIC family phosphatase [Streptomyces sp. NBC_00237]MCX5205049.1 HAD-IIIC family phosphatase [Streptomyces sp. NBC_00237]